MLEGRRGSWRPVRQWEVPGIKTLGSVRLDLTGPATTLAHKFETPLRSDMQSRYDDAEFTVEIDLSWQADPGAPPLDLACIPVPLAGPADRG